MNTTYDDKIKAFVEALRPKNEKEKIQFEAEKIHFDFIFLLKDLMENQGITKKQLAESLGVAPSYITQLFNGSKLVNLKTLAKIQQLFDLKFKIVPAREIPFRYKKHYYKPFKFSMPKKQFKMFAA